MGQLSSATSYYGSQVHESDFDYFLSKKEYQVSFAFLKFSDENKLGRLKILSASLSKIQVLQFIALARQSFLAKTH